jgi:hypothetical protein
MPEAGWQATKYVSTEYIVMSNTNGHCGVERHHCFLAFNLSPNRDLEHATKRGAAYS